MSISSIHGRMSPQQPQRPTKGQGPEALAKALGISVEQLNKMSPKDVEKLAKEKHVDLKQFGNPQSPPPNQQAGNNHKNVF